jgi:YEATS domain-containing protein 4
MSAPITRPFVYGSHAAPLSKTDVPSDPSHTHIWTIFVRGVDGEDLSYFIDRVEIKLHESFKNPRRVYSKPPYEVTETGWGQFEIVITVYFIDSTEAPVTLYHMLQLYHKDGKNNKGPVISEKYDEFVFYSPGVDLRDALMSHPPDSVEKPKKHDTFSKND